MSDYDFSVSIDSIETSPVRTVLHTILTTVLDVSVNVGISTALETVFPAYDPKKNVWWGALEAVAEITLHVIISNLLLLAFGRVLSTSGSLAPVGALVGIFLLSGALQKLWAFQSYLVQRTVGNITAKSKELPVSEEA